MANPRRSEAADAAAVDDAADVGTALYVYGVVPKDTPPDVFADVGGVDPAHPVVLAFGDEAAAITSEVALREFGTDAVEANLRNPDWLREKVVAHEHVLNAALAGATSVVPFRFGAIYDDEAHVHRLLADRSDFPELLARFAGTHEWGVKAFLDREGFRERLARQRGLADADASGGREYMLRRQLERELDDAAVAFAADCADAAHARLEAVALEGRTNPAQRAQDDEPDVMFLNAAYLLRRDEDDRFEAELASLQREYEPDGVRFERTGPWAPYNFVDGQEPA